MSRAGMSDRSSPRGRPSDEVLAWRADWIVAASGGPDVPWLGPVCGAALLLASLYLPDPGEGRWSPPVTEHASRVLSPALLPMSEAMYFALERLGVIALRCEGVEVLGYRLVAFAPDELDWDGCGRVLRPL